MKTRTRIIFIVLLLTQLLAVYQYQTASTIPDGLDEIDVSQDAVRWNMVWFHFDARMQYVKHVFAPGTKTPPVFFWLYALISEIIGPGWIALKAVPGLGFLMILIGVFLVAKESADEKAGILAMFLVGSYPLVFGFSHTSNTSCLAAGFEIMAVAFALRSRDMVKPLTTLAAGVFVALAVMSERGTPGLLLIAPMSYFVLRTLYRLVILKEDVLRRSLLLGLFIITPIIIAGPYVYTYLMGNWAYNVKNITKDVFKLHQYWPWPQHIWAFYIVELGRRQMGGLLALGVVLSAIPLIKNKAREYPMLLVGFFGPLFVFSFFATKEVAYDFGILPMGAAITAAGIYSLKNRRRQQVAVWLILPIALLTYMVGIGKIKSNPEWPIFFQKAFLVAFITPDSVLHGGPTLGAPLAEATETMMELVGHKQKIFVAISDERQRVFAWAMMVDIAAKRPDSQSILIPFLPGSEKQMVVATMKYVASPFLDEQLVSTCGTDLAVCDLTPDEQAGKTVSNMFIGTTIEPVKILKWDDQIALLGVFK